MLRQIKICALSFLLCSSAYAVQDKKNCLIIMVGGGKEWLSLVPGFKSDISIWVDRAAKVEAERTGCRVISGHNQSPQEFTEMFKKASRPPYFTKGTTVHMTFTDHGTPQPEDGLGGSIYLGNRLALRHNDFANILKSSFPKGSRITFDTSTCWGNLSDMVRNLNLDNNFDICGSSSTHPNHWSYNARAMSKNNGVSEGPYSALSLSLIADNFTKGRKAPSVTESHYTAKHGDVGNLFRIPGFTSSLSYAHRVLTASGRVPSVDFRPLESMLETNLHNTTTDKAKIHFSREKMQQDIAAMLNDPGCELKSGLEFHAFIEFATSMYQYLSNVIPAHTPSPYKEHAIKSSAWLKTHQNRLPRLLTDFFQAKMLFWAKNKDRAQDEEESEELLKEWEELERKLKEPLRDYLFHARIMQEALTVAEFMTMANPAQKARFNKFVACEKRPVL